MEAFISSFMTGAGLLLGDPLAIALFFAGLFGGMLFGAIPGINMLTLGAVLLPFTAMMSAPHAIMLYSVLYCSGVFGGAITAILFNIPGSPENAPTAFDGYPMSLKGEAGKAIGAAVICSALGGAISVLIMMAATPIIAVWAIRNFGQPEIFALICFGLAVSASVGAKDIWRGLLSVCLGLSVALVGTDPVDGVPRFTFGSMFMLAGIHFIPVVLGLFAVAEVLSKGSEKLQAGSAGGKYSVTFPTIREFWAEKITVARSVVIGFFAGLLPGIGATLASFLSYGEAVRWGGKKKKFGTGEIQGVISSETANNSATGAAMIPLLALGLPGGALTAMMMGVFQLHGMQPGPGILRGQHDLVWLVFVAMFFANVCILALGYIQTKTVVHLLKIPFHLLAPVILAISTIGAFAVRNQILDVWVMFIAGIIGFFLRKTGYSIAGVVLGVILGSIGESSFAVSMQMLDYSFVALLQRPIAAVLLAGAVLTILVSMYSALRRAGRGVEA